MGMRALPEMYAQQPEGHAGPRAVGHTFQAKPECSVLWNSYQANSLKTACSR